MIYIAFYFSYLLSKDGQSFLKTLLVLIRDNVWLTMTLQTLQVLRLFTFFLYISLLSAELSRTEPNTAERNDPNQMKTGGYSPLYVMFLIVIILCVMVLDSSFD